MTSGAQQWTGWGLEAELRFIDSIAARGSPTLLRGYMRGLGQRVTGWRQGTELQHFDRDVARSHAQRHLADMVG